MSRIKRVDTYEQSSVSTAPLVGRAGNTDRYSMVTTTSAISSGLAGGTPVSRSSTATPVVTSPPHLNTRAISSEDCIVDLVASPRTSHNVRRHESGDFEMVTPMGQEAEARLTSPAPAPHEAVQLGDVVDHALSTETARLHNMVASRVKRKGTRSGPRPGKRNHRTQAQHRVHTARPQNRYPASKNQVYALLPLPFASPYMLFLCLCVLVVVVW